MPLLSCLRRCRRRVVYVVVVVVVVALYPHRRRPIVSSSRRRCHAVVTRIWLALMSSLVQPPVIDFNARSR